MEFRKTYDKYRKQGLEIYQVSLDRREHFWQQSATNFPWICVRDSRGTAARLYNVGELPTYFLINRDGEVVLRNTQVKDLNKEIEKLLGAR
jgi:peroxiredoxin